MKLACLNIAIASLAAAPATRPAEPAASKAARIHAAVMDTRVFRYGMTAKDVEAAIGKADKVSRTLNTFRLIYVAGYYRLDVTLADSGGIRAFEESGDIPNDY